MFVFLNWENGRLVFGSSSSGKGHAASPAAAPIFQERQQCQFSSSPFPPPHFAHNLLP